jgi:hypothetical protein
MNCGNKLVIPSSKFLNVTNLKKRFAKINLGTVPDNRFGILFEEECKDTGVPEAFDPKAVTSGNGTFQQSEKKAERFRSALSFRRQPALRCLMRRQPRRQDI